MVAYLFFFHMVHWSFILGQGWLLSNHFCKACQNCLRPSSVIVHNAVRMHELLLCCERSRICHHIMQHKHKLRPIFFDMFYKIDCCAAVHGRIWMNNVPNESKIIMLSCTESVMLYFFDFEKFGVKPWFLFV